MNRLQELRLAKGMTQPEMSKLLKEIDSRIDVGMVSRFEKGVCLPTPAVTEALAKILNCSVSDIFCKEDVENITTLGGELQQPKAVCGFVAEVLNHIPESREKAVTKEYLVHKTGHPERVVRRAIEQARLAGYLICSDTDSKGYYISNDVDDIERQFRQDKNRANKIMQRSWAFREILKKEGRL